ncbi:MAG: class I SAM-dependent methyltransferase, partial [Alphaproteobacteria bacterium]|nr:class I SAM-dependent methyltransferase [Alphaproteobacteria bacterium]
EVVQSQSLALLGRDQPCAIAFGVCTSCGHLQQWPLVPPELMAQHYQSIATYELFGDPEQLRAAAPARHARRFLSLVADIGLAPGRAYEIGCASGEMLHQFRRQGWEVAGCDPSPSAISQAKAIFDIAANLGGEEETLPHQKNLDLILACHVLEHLYDPPAALARFHAALAPNGHLVLEVPCAIAPEQLPPGWFTFEHLHYYQPAILERLLKAGGFEIVEMRIAMTCEHYPVVAIAARKSGAPATQLCTFAPSDGVRMARTYAARDQTLWAATAQRMEKFNQPVFLYGAGIHTAQLLDHTDLGNRVIAIADRDSKKWGQTQAGKPVISPAELLAHPVTAPVIISSYVSEGAIMKTLREGGLAASRIVPLYSDIPAC